MTISRTMAAPTMVVPVPVHLALPIKQVRYQEALIPGFSLEGVWVDGLMELSCTEVDEVFRVRVGVGARARALL